MYLAHQSPEAGIDDQEFVVAFEGDDPHDFVDLVNDLRFTEASMYTLSDTPMHIAIAMSLPEVMDSIGGEIGRAHV